MARWRFLSVALLLLGMVAAQAQLTTYENTGLGYRIGFPSDWVVEDSPDGDDFLVRPREGSDAYGRVAIEFFVGEPWGDSLEEAVDDLLFELLEELPDLQVLRRVAILGLGAAATSFDVRGSDWMGDDVTLRVVVALQGEYLYALFLEAVSEDFAAYLPLFEQVQASLALHGAPGPGPVAPATYAGTFESDQLTLVLERSAAGGMPPGVQALEGTLRFGDQEFPVVATLDAREPHLAGSFASAGSHFAFTATLVGDTLTFVTGGASYVLHRHRPPPPDPACNPLVPGSCSEPEPDPPCNPLVPGSCSRSQPAPPPIPITWATCSEPGQSVTEPARVEPGPIDGSAAFDRWEPGDGGSGWVAVAHGAGATSARGEFVRAMQMLSGVLDEPPTFWGVVNDRDDTIAQMPFLGVWRGARIAGLAVASVRDGRSTIGVAFDDASLAPLTMDGLVRQLGPDVRLIAPPEPLQPVVWDRHRAADGSFHVSVPRDWTLEFAADTALAVKGPGEEQVLLALTRFPLQPDWATQFTTDIVAPYQDPVSALHTIFPEVFARIGRQQLTVGNVLSCTREPSEFGAQVALMLWEEAWDGRPYLAYGYVVTSNMPVSWLFYMSAVRAPVEVFGASFPTMIGIWSSQEINPQVYWNRMQSAMRNLVEAGDILYETVLDTSRRREARMYDWAETYRGSAIVRDPRTGEERPFDLAFVHETVDGLNRLEGAAVYEYVPMREWWQGR